MSAAGLLDWFNCLCSVKTLAMNIIYQIYDERVDFYADNEEKSTIFYVQIDIFSRDERVESLSEAIKKVLEEKEYRLINIFGRYEKDTKLYHKILRFNFSKLKED